jgi:hypothetical protein
MSNQALRIQHVHKSQDVKTHAQTSELLLARENDHSSWSARDIHPKDRREIDDPKSLYNLGKDYAGYVSQEAFQMPIKIHARRWNAAAQRHTSTLNRPV